jgi:hypothetical protein
VIVRRRSDDSYNCFPSTVMDHMFACMSRRPLYGYAYAMPTHGGRWPRCGFTPWSGAVPPSEVLQQDDMASMCINTGNKTNLT